METEFPQADKGGNRMKPNDFRKPVTLEYKGYEKFEPTPLPDGTMYVISHSDGEWAHKNGVKLLGKKSMQPFRNEHYDDRFPKGYAVRYHFSDRVLESSSKPLYEAFIGARVRPNDLVEISAVGEKSETKWFVEVVKDVNATGTVPF